MSIKLFKCFIASPSDTQQEREVCDKVFDKINKTIGEQLGFRVESKKWEKDARPSFGTDGQSVINEQLLKDYHLFIGIMWNQFGTPTKRAGSGTEEEFLNAYDRYISKSDIKIMLYFNEQLSRADALDLNQLQKVREFKKKVSGLGSFYKKYDGRKDFEEKLYQNIYDHFAEKLGSQSSNVENKEEAGDLSARVQYENVLLTLKNRLNDALCRVFDNLRV